MGRLGNEAKTVPCLTWKQLHIVSHVEPSHAQVLEWRVVLERLERFVKLCNSLVLELLQRLVMTAVFTLEHFIERAVEKSASLAKQQRQEFQKMWEQVLSQPSTQSVLDRHIFNVEEEDIVIQTISFGAFMPSEGVCEYIHLHNCMHVGVSTSLQS